jgi:hypothetical protein
MTRSRATLLVLALLPSAPAAAQEGGARICLAPASVESNAGDAAAASEAVREAFTSYLTGPTLGVTPLQARLASQVRQEAKLASCPYLLLTSLKHHRKSGGGGLLGRMAGGAVQHGASAVVGSAGSTAGRAAAGAAASAANAAASDLATASRSDDELTLKYRLETADGGVLLEKTAKRKAKADGEDLLTPLVGAAAEAIAAAVSER